MPSLHIFMRPTAFIVMPFREPYEKIYRAVIGPQLDRLDFEAKRADQIQSSSDINNDIVTGIQDASLVIIEASEENANVYFEFGLAVAASKEFLLLAKRGTKLPFDTQRWRHLFYDVSEDLSELKAELKKWIENTDAFKAYHSGTHRRLMRGEIFPNIIDACIFTEPSNSSFRTRLLDEIRSGSMLSCAYSYYTELGSHHWLNLCNDPLYKVFGDSLRILGQQADRIFSCIGSDFLKYSPDFISLGPGNGQKDRVLLRALLRRLKEENVFPQLFYYPFDISQTMICQAVQTISKDYELGSRLKVKAMLGEFGNLHDFRPVYDFRAAPNIFAFLGNTLGNISQEVVFLQRIKTAMGEGDVMLLEVRHKTDVIQAGGEDEEQFGLSFAPLAMLGVSFDLAQVHIREESEVSQIRGTKTLAMHYKEARIDTERFSDIFLSCVNYYDPNELERVISGTTLNFEILDIVKGELMVMFVLRKA